MYESASLTAVAMRRQSHANRSLHALDGVVRRYTPAASAAASVASAAIILAPDASRDLAPASRAAAASTDLAHASTCGDHGGSFGMRSGFLCHLQGCAAAPSSVIVAGRSNARIALASAAPATRSSLVASAAAVFAAATIRDSSPYPPSPVDDRVSDSAFPSAGDP